MIYLLTNNSDSFTLTSQCLYFRLSVNTQATCDSAHNVYLFCYYSHPLCRFIDWQLWLTGVLCKQDGCNSYRLIWPKSYGDVLWLLVKNFLIGIVHSFLRRTAEGYKSFWRLYKSLSWPLQLSERRWYIVVRRSFWQLMLVLQHCSMCFYDFSV